MLRCPPEGIKISLSAIISVPYTLVLHYYFLPNQFGFCKGRESSAVATSRHLATAIMIAETHIMACLYLVPTLKYDLSNYCVFHFTRQQA